MDDDSAVPEPRSRDEPLLSAKPSMHGAARAQGRRLRWSESRLRAIEEASPVGMALMEPAPGPDAAHPDFRYSYVNPAAERIIGRPAAEVVGRTLLELFPPDAVAEALEHYRAVLRAGGTRHYELSHTAATGIRWFDVTVAALGNGLGVYFTEITMRKRGEALERYVAEAGAILARSLDLDTTLTALVELAVPDLADWCAVDLLQADGTLRRVAVAHRDVQRRAIAEELVRRYPYELQDANGIGAVIRTGRAEWAPEIPEDAIDRIPEPDQRAMLLTLGLRSYIIVPLQSGTESFGAFSLVQAESGRRFSAQDVDIARSLAGRAATAIINARLFEEALRARAAADEASRVKSQFLANMSHEIRTPINAIIGYLELLSLGIAGPVTDRQAQYLGRISASSRHLRTVVNDVLDLAKVESGDIEVARESVDVAAVVREALAIVAPFIDGKGLRLVADDACADAHAIWADRDRVRQILVNLLSNAVKFTTAGEIRVRCTVAPADDARSGTAGDGFTAVAVQDTGIGIPEAMHERIFEPFIQLSTGPTRAAPGTGLGLSISRSFARAMGGDIRVASAPGAGSTFTLLLPTAAPAPAGGG